jgi:Pectate lyase superfamily protein
MKRRSLLLGPAALAMTPSNGAGRFPTDLAPGAETASPSPVLDVRHFGADATGVAASDGALVRAIDACGDSGGTIRFPAGTYCFEQSINLGGKRSVVFVGDGVTTAGSPSATRLIYTGKGDGVFINMNAAIGCHLRGLQIAHRDAHFKGTYIKCSNVGTNDPAFCTLVDCVLGSLVGPGTVHLDLDRCIEFTAERCNFICGNPSVLGRSARGYANAIRFRDCQWSACHSAPIRGGGASWTFAGCTFENLLSGAAGALVSGDAAGAFNALVITGCWFGDASAGGTWIDIYGYGGHICGNYIQGSTRGVVGVALHRCAGVQLAGNLFELLSVGLDFADGPCRDIVFQGNIANGVTTGFRNADKALTGSLVWAPNYGFGSPGAGHVMLGSNGYTADASCGLIRQWGAAPLISGRATQFITFPLRFPAQCLNVVATLSGGSNGGTVAVGSINAEGFESTVGAASGAATLYWQALGT